MAAFGTTPVVWGGMAVDRRVFRLLLPNHRWLVYAAGLVDPGDANTATLELVYQKDDGTLVSLGSVTQAGSGQVKKTMGPFDVFATVGVPPGENVPVIRLRATKNAGANGDATTWVVWNRFIPPVQS